MVFLRRQFPLLIAFTMGIVFAFQHFVPHQKSEDMLTEVNDWLIIIGSFAMLLGLVSLVHSHWRKIRQGVAGYGYSVVVFVSILVTVVIGVRSKGELFEGGAITGLGWLYYNMLVPLQGTMFSILAFFIASAAFRAFRVKSLDAGLLLTAAVVVLFGRVVWGELLMEWISQGYVSMDSVVGWIMTVPNMAARRGIMLGVALGAIATSLKIIFGIERSYLGGGGE